MKRLLSVVLCLCMVMTLLPAVATAASYTDYHITSYDFSSVESALSGVADVQQNGTDIVITLLDDIDGRLHIGENNRSEWSGNFVLDLNDKTIDPGTSFNEGICLDNNFEGNFTITGSGTIKTGNYNIIYTWDANIIFAVEDGYDYFTLKKDGSDYFTNEKNTTAQTEDWKIRGTELVMSQGKFEAPAGYTTNINGVMAYKYNDPGFDIRGIFDSKWKETSFSDTYSTFLKVGETTKEVKAVASPTGYDITDLNMNVAIDFNFMNNGKTLQLLYTVKNNSSEEKTFSLGTGTDIQIGSDDNATITPFADESGFKMVSSSDYDKNSEDEYAQFNFFGKGYVGVTDVSDFWYGKYSSGAEYHWNGNNSVAVFYGKNESASGNFDSAASWHWADRTLGAGESTTFSVLIGIGGADSQHAAESTTHSHPVCGDNACTDTNHTNITWEKWTSADSLPTSAGNYYLAQDVTLSGTWYIPDSVNLCLNGCEIELGGDYILCDLEDNDALSVCDCTGGGKISAPTGTAIGFNGDNAEFNLYSGTLYSKDGNTIGDKDNPTTGNTANIYGGAVTGEDIPAIGVANVTVNLYGGTVSTSQNNGVVFLDSAILNLCGNTVISHGSSFDSIKAYNVSLIDATGYTGNPVTVYYANTNAASGDIVVTGVTDETAGKISLSSEKNLGFHFERNGSNLVYTADAPTNVSGTLTGSRYTVKFESNGGSAVASKRVGKNGKLSVPQAPVKNGFVFDGWYTDNDLKTAYDFDSKVTKSFTLYAKWTAKPEDNTHNCPAKRFGDLDITAWYHEDIDYVIENGIFKGVTDRSFAPGSKLTRAMLVTVLYRIENEPATNKSIPFGDIDMGTYYASAVSWAQQNGIVKGVSETEFAPDNNITREQFAAIMFRYAQYKGMNAVTTEENLHFTDTSEISEYAVSAMNWAVGTGLLKGKTATTLNPKDSATRAESAAILHRFIEGGK